MRFGLRARVVAAVVLVTTTATAVMAYAAYQLQASDSVERYSTAAMAEMSSLWSRTSPWVDQAPAEDKLMVIANEATVDQTEWLVVAKKAGAPFSVVRSSDTGQLAPVFRVLSDGKLAQLPAAPPQPVDLPDKEQILKNVEAEVLPHLDGPAFHGTAITTDPRTGKKILVIGIYFFKTDYYLVEMFDLSVLDTDLAALRWKLVYIAAGVSVLGIGAALLIARRIRRPILSVSGAAKELGEGALDVRVPVKGHDEVADLARSFNAMAQRLGESIDQQRRFVADVAHDLRTPLASMVAVVDNLDDATPATRTRATEILGTQARRLARLVEDLLEIARFDAGKAELQTEIVDLAALVADAAEVSDVDIALTGRSEVVADPRRVHTVVTNLLTNAARHGAAPITVTIEDTGSEVVLRVRDSGPGVPEDLLPILFDRFVRGDHARQTGGNGLGLSIARENTLVHGGTLTVHNDGGAVFTLTLPRQTTGILNND